jgi:glucose/arabinose dehydrogenase
MRGGAAGVGPSQGQPVVLYDGGSLEGWTHIGPGRFVQGPDSTISTEGGMGLLYYTPRTFRDFSLELDYKADSPGANSGIFVRFPERTEDPWVPVNSGYEIQIDDSQDALHRTGSVYTFSPAAQLATKPAGEWNHYRIQVTGQRYQIWLNGTKVNDFIGDRGREGYIGLQNHDPDSKVHFRNIVVTPLNAPDAPESLAELVAVPETRAPIRVLVMTATQGFRHAEAIQASREVLGAADSTTEFDFDFTEDLGALTPENLAKYDLVFMNNSTLRVKPAENPQPGSIVYDLKVQMPDGPRDGRLVLRADSSTLRIGGMPPMSLQDVRVSDATVSFRFDAGEYGQVQATAQRQGDRLTGTFAASDGSVGFSGARQNGFVGGQYTPVSPAQEKALLDFVRGGKGLVVSHSGLDAFYGSEGYREMVGGGLFKEHPWTQPVQINVEDRDNPADAHLGDSFWVRDEIYVLDEDPRWNSHVLLSLDMPSVGVVTGHADATRDDYPISWIRNYGEGRVFVTKLGHFADVWRNPDFLRHLLTGMREAAGRVPADFGGHRVKETIAKDVWPDDLAIDDQGNVWIAELTGRVLRYDAQTKQTQVVAEVPTTDPTNIEHGLFGIEVDPDFYDGQPYVYLYRAIPESFVNTLSRFTYHDGKIDLSTEEVLLRVPTEPSCCHQSGDLEWGPDGTLFVSTGDTGQSSVKPEDEIGEARVAAFEERNKLTGHHWSRIADSERTAQNLQSLRGKVLRINKDGSIPKDNPFFGRPGVRWEIWAYGLRNPYRIKWDDQTERLFIGIVGPDEQTTYDWYDVSTGGENFGWPRATGRLVYNEWTPQQIPNYQPPTWGYTYEGGSRSASGGPVYRSTGPRAFPMLQDKVIVYDWSRKWIKYGDLVNGTWTSDTTGSVRADGRQFSLPAKRLAHLKTFDVLEATSPISMEVGPDGCIYVAEFDGFWRPANNSKANVSRYCWVPGTPAAPAAPTATEAGGR